MSLLDDASLIVTPNGYKASKLYSVKPTDASGDMVVSRATTATRVNSSNLIESVAINVPRLDYTLGSCPSILIEPLRTNLVFPSATLTTQTRTVTAVANTLSFYGTGTIVLTGVHTATLTGTGANDRVSLTFTPTAGSLILTVTGTVTNAQLEAGSNATSYIPTTTATVTRNADVISKTGISSLIGQTEGTIFVEFNNQVLSSTILCINKNITNSIFLLSSSAGILRATVYANSVAYTTFFTGYTTFNEKIKMCLKYGSFGTKLFINGALKATNANAIVFTSSLSSIHLNDDVILNSNTTIRNNSSIIFKTALSDPQCIDLTTP